MQTARIKILDSFRGIAALIVVFHHVFSRFYYLYSNRTTGLLYSVLNFISELNVMAVMFFFLLSGFSIRLSLKNGVPNTKTILNDYLYRRLKRILPLYIVALLLTFVCGIILHQLHSVDYSLKNLAGNLLFLQSSVAYKGYWFSPYGGNGPLWSLPFEMFYYLFFPIFIFIFFKLYRKEKNEQFYSITLIASLLFSLLCIGVNNHFFFPYIAFGTLFYIWYSGYFLAEAYLQKSLLKLNTFLLFFISAIILKLLLVKVHSDNLEKMFMGSLFGVVFYCLYFMRKRYAVQFTAYFDAPVNFLFCKIGKGSYALYLLHFPILLILHYFNAGLFMIGIVVCLLVALSIRLEEYFVAKKFLFLKRRYVR